MILPSKHLSEDRALLTVGAMLLQHLSRPMTVSALWEAMTQFISAQKHLKPLRFDGFVLALDILFLMDAIDLDDGLLRRKSP